VARIFPLVVLGLGGAACVLPLLSSLFALPQEELTGELPYAAASALFLVSPYVGLSWLGQQARPLVGYGALALLLMSSGLVLFLASSDAQGGIIAFYIVPLQWLVAASARPRPSTAGRGDVPIKD